MQLDELLKQGKESDKRSRKLRVERSSFQPISAEEDHGWAVSYADLLMVILSFFVIFFSKDKDEKQSVIQQIVTEMDGKRSPSSAKDQASQNSRGLVANGTGNSNYTGSRNSGATLSAYQSPVEKDQLKKHLHSLSQQLLNFNIKTEKRAEAIIYRFPDNIFAKNKFHMNKPHKEHLFSLLKKLKPYYDKVDIVFIGHTDQNPVTKPFYNGVVKNNFDLSSLRANSALRAALEVGIPRGNLYTISAAKNSGASRTISLMIRPIGETL